VARSCGVLQPSSKSMVSDAEPILVPDWAIYLIELDHSRSNFFCTNGSKGQGSVAEGILQCVSSTTESSILTISAFQCAEAR